MNEGRYRFRWDRCQTNCYLFAELVMKQLPDEKELAELVELARIAAEKARAMSDMATVIAQKYQKRMHAVRQAAIQLPMLKL